MTRLRPPAPIAGSCARAKAAPVRDLALVGFLAALLALGFKRPFLFVLAYAYVDIVSPQRLSYYLLNSIPVSMIVAGLSFAGWLIADDKRHFKVTGRQWLMMILLAYAGWTTLRADLYADALFKWEWVWKAMAWADRKSTRLNSSH